MKSLSDNEIKSFELELFSSSNIEDYKCLICAGIPFPDNCSEVTCCGHLFCSNCIEEWLSKNGSCPICKEKIENNNLDILPIKAKSKFIYRQMKALELKCPFKCDWKGPLGDLVDKHLESFECKNIKQKCKYHLFGCNFTERGEKLKEHEENNDKMHLELALKAAEMGRFPGKKILTFDLNDKIKVDYHPHKLTFKSRGRYGKFGCDGRHLPGGCPYGAPDDPNRHHFDNDVPRYCCHDFDYDLCNYCAIRHVVK